MEIVGVGFGRTGTTSTRIALNQLGFGPCYHMMEVFLRPWHIPAWQAAADGNPPDWHKFFSHYRSGIDYPLSAFTPEILAAFPDAKVILNVRDPQAWWESTAQTIYQQIIFPEWILKLSIVYRGLKQMVHDAIWGRLFDDRFMEKEYAIEVFNRHIEEVKTLVPPERLLIFDVRQGWQPLCEFLDVPVPDRPFPHSNSRFFIRLALAATRLGALFFAAGLFGALLFLLLAFF